MKQYSFDKKKEILFSKECEFATTQLLKEKLEWNLTNVDERQKQLAKLAVDTWRI